MVGRGTDLSLVGKHVQKPRDLSRPEVARMATLVKVNEAADPSDVGSFRSAAIMLSAEHDSGLLEQTRRARA